MANNKYAGITSLGPGAIEDQGAAPKPSLEGVSEYQYVSLTNPLPFTFIGKVAQSRPVNAPIRIVSDGVSDGGAKVTEDTLAAAGITLRNKDHVGRLHVTNKVTIESGQTINLRGDEAQVILRQLVDAVLGYEGKTLRIGNPAYRKEAEGKIISRVSSIEDLLDSSLTSVDQQINVAIAKKNEESAFPTLKDPVSLDPHEFELNGLTFKKDVSDKGLVYTKNGKEIEEHDWEVALGQYNGKKD